MTTKVKLRQKPISGKRVSLYLDFYPPIQNAETGKLSRREFLGLYLHDKPKNPIDKIHNSETQSLAEQIRQKKESQLNKPEIYSSFERDRLRSKKMGEASFLDYFQELTRKRKSSNHDNWVSAFHYLKTFANGKLNFEDLDIQFCEGFKEYLLSTTSKRTEKSKLSQNSAFAYFNKLRATLKQAFKDGHLTIDLNSRITSIKPEETRRNFLTIEELESLVDTECNNKLLKRASLFSALTGLRHSDIKKLTWGEIESIAGQGYFIHYKQSKTKGIETLPISEQAYNLLGERQEPSKQVFEGLKYSAYHNKSLGQWLGAAGITKDITFHCFRHTFATLQLSQGTGLYTVSKMLGHKDIKTTQIYAKVIDQTKREAANKIKLSNL